MKRSTAFIIAVWGLVLANSVSEGVSLPNSQIAKGFAGSQWDFFTLWILPFAVSSSGAFLFRRRIMDFPHRYFAPSFDAWFGEGRFAIFVSRLKPIALFMAYFLVSGTTGLVASYLRAPTVPTRGAYLISGSFFAYGFGLLAAYLLSIRFPPMLR